MPSERELLRSLRFFSTDKLKRMRADLEDQIAENIHASTTSEVGRSETNQLLAEVHAKHEVVCHLLMSRGELSQDEVDNAKAGAPVTEMNIRFAPKHGYYPTRSTSENG